MRGSLIADPVVVLATTIGLHATGRGLRRRDRSSYARLLQPEHASALLALGNTDTKGIPAT